MHRLHPRNGVLTFALRNECSLSISAASNACAAEVFPSRSKLLYGASSLNWRTVNEGAGGRVVLLGQRAARWGRVRWRGDEGRNRMRLGGGTVAVSTAP